MSTEQNNVSPLKAIRKHCIDCCGGSKHEVKLCTCTDCDLFIFRFGRNPNLSRKLSGIEKDKFQERMRLAKEAQCE